MFPTSSFLMKTHHINNYNYGPSLNDITIYFELSKPKKNSFSIITLNN